MLLRGALRAGAELARPPCPPSARWYSVRYASARAQQQRSLEKWVDDCVIGHALCPFAADVVRRNALRVCVSHCETQDALLDACRVEIVRITGTGGAPPETTMLGVGTADLLAPPRFLGSFSSFLGAAVLVEALCDELTAGTACELQLAVFHPLARAALLEHSKPLAAMMAAAEEQGGRGGDGGAVADLAIRAPLPTFHFLRSADVQAAAATFAGTEEIPARNRSRLHALARKKQLGSFEACLGASACAHLQMDGEHGGSVGAPSLINPD